MSANVKKTQRTISEDGWPRSVDRFINFLRTSERSPHTLHHYREDLAAFAEWWASHSVDTLHATAITTFDIQAWRDDLRNTPLPSGRRRKPTTVNTKVAALRSFLHWAEYAKVIKEVPRLPRKEKPGRRMVRWLDRKQLHQLLRRAAARPRDLAIIQILLETGLRVAELIDLRWFDIEMSPRKGWLNVRAGKGRKPRRIPLSRIARESFEVLGHAKYRDSEGPVFHGQRGPLKIRGVQQVLANYESARIGLANLTPHMLRHTFAITLRDRGVPWPTIAALMGHESVKTTMDNYGVASERDMEAALGVDQEED